jgi:hypothetical protein
MQVVEPLPATGRHSHGLAQLRAGRRHAAGLHQGLAGNVGQRDTGDAKARYVGGHVRAA